MRAIKRDNKVAKLIINSLSFTVTVDTCSIGRPVDGIIHPDYVPSLFVYKPDASQNHNKHYLRAAKRNA